MKSWGALVPPSRTAAVCALSFAVGCTPQPSPSPTPPPTTVTAKPAGPSAEEIKQALEASAKKARTEAAKLTYDQWKAKVYKEKFAGGKYIVNGDTPILDEKQLEEFFQERIKETEVIVHRVGNMDAVWDAQAKRALAYCVSNSFGPRQAAVIQDMEAATGAWEAAVDVDFVHQAAEDGRCDANNQAVVFDVRPVDVGGEYLARAFFPNEPRSARNVLIDQSSFGLDPAGKLTLVGILRHELGHTIGLRHEHTRPDSGACFEDSDWRPLTSYDAFSVMHYPQCNGRGDWSLTLTAKDKSGTACLYGPAAGFTIDPAICTPATPPPSAPPGVAPQTKTFPQQRVASGEEKEYGPFAVVAGSVITAKMGPGTGDPDLYLKIGQKPTRTDYDCRPFTASANETCSGNVPAGATQAFVMVHGYRPGTYTLTVTHTPPAP